MTTKSKATQERKPQHKWLSAAKLAKFFAIPLAKAKEILHTNGLASFTGVPTAKSIEDGLVEVRTSAYAEDEVYYVWCYEKVKDYFVMPSAEQEAVFFTSRRQADKKLMEAIEKLGELNGIRMSKYGGNDDRHIPPECGLKESTINAVVECHFSDPHFYGVFAFEYADSRDKVAAIFEKIWPVVNDLMAHIPEIKNKQKQAQLALMTIQAAEKWLGRVAQKQGG